MKLYHAIASGMVAAFLITSCGTSQPSAYDQARISLMNDGAACGETEQETVKKIDSDFKQGLITSQEALTRLNEIDSITRECEANIDHLLEHLEATHEANQNAAMLGWAIMNR